MSDFDDLKRLAIDSQTTLGDFERVANARRLAAAPWLTPTVFYKVCASLEETADQFETLCGYREIALCEVLPRLIDETLPTIGRCYDPRAVDGELLYLGKPFWRGRDTAYLARLLEKHTTSLGATPDGPPLRICRVFTDRQRLDDMCRAGPQPKTWQEENEAAIALVAKRLKEHSNPDALTKEYLRDLVKRSGCCGAGWDTTHRFDEYVWKQARERAGLPSIAPKGRRPGR